MSRPTSTLTTQANRASFASKAAWDALGIESGEESEEEVQIEEPEPETVVAGPPSKSAIKKAKALARIEKRQQEKAARAAARAQANGKASLPAELSTDSLPSSTPESPMSPPQVLNEVVEEPAPAPAATSSPTNEPIFSSSLKSNEKPAPEPKTQPTKPVAQPDPPQVAEVISPPLPPQPAQTANLPQKVNEKRFDKQTQQQKQQQKQPVQDAEKAKKRQNVLTRTIWTLIMIGGFLTLLLMGHAYMIVLVFLCQTIVYREVTTLFSLKRKPSDEESNNKDPWSKTLNWYFFAVVNYFLYGESIIYYFKHVVFSDAQLTSFATNHRFISFCLYILGFMGFVMSLKRGYLKQQFGLFCWVHMTLLLIVVSSHFIVNNILEGMIWFFVPASLVICNDVFAYIWGVTVGRTPLIKLSPKKTVEGFVGAFFSTIIFGVFWGTLFMRYKYMICPTRDLGVSAFDEDLTCTPNPVFVWRDWQMPGALSAFVSTVLGHSITTIPWAPYQFHVLAMSCFASLVAPFGGFFASGFKRAFDIKDFGHSIPGHGGMTDRMDCQFLMGVFTYVYYSSLIRDHHVTVGSALQMIVSGLTVAEQLELMKDLKRYLEGQGIPVNL